MSNSTGETGTRDVTFDLISVIYHALQGAETYDRYIRDAQQGGDKDLGQFFQEVKDRNKKTADRAKELLARQLSRS